MDFNIALLPGDGVGPEVMNSAVAVLSAIESKFNHKFNLTRYDIGGAALEKTGVPLPQETVAECIKADGVLYGAVGGPQWMGMKPHLRPDKALLNLRQAMGLSANLRPAVVHSELGASCPLRPDIVKSGVDIMVISDVSGGVFLGEHGYREGELGQEAFDTEVYSISEIEYIANLAFLIAMTRNKKVTSVDKADVYETSRLWRATVDRVAKRYPEVTVRHMHVGYCAIQLVKDPSQFDVILSSSMYGDIISDEAAAISGSLCMLPSSSIGAGSRGLYGPIHGPMSNIAGYDEVNPIGMILATAMMLSWSLKLYEEAAAIESAVRKVLAKGLRTADIAAKHGVKCSRITEEIALAILNA
ncbi:MAG: 3-isopropylmalate dehydrogenase [Clostridiales bacterium]|nr:3-isopropylmalate dehydrogenase [Clostridiales bacterium]